ncbi:XRE family transcriptional regulator, partial [Vibrio cholerae]|nr:XRE family transcriptional regulator [Vibrio cholerae]
ARLCEAMIVFTEMNVPLTEALLGAADALKDVNNGFEPSDDLFLEDVHEINTMSYLKVTTPIAQQAASLIPTFIEGDTKKDKLVAKYMKEVGKVEQLKSEIAELKKRL